MAKRKTPVSVWAATRTADPSVGGAAVTGPVAKASTKQLRRWSRTNPWLRAIINMRRRQVAMARYVIVPEDDSVVANPALVAPVLKLLEQPNPKGESWRSFIEPIVEDILVLDQGCFEIEGTVGGRLGLSASIKYLWNVDGGSIRFDPHWDGTDPSRPRYFQYTDSGLLLQSFLNTELTVVMENPTTYSPIGMSALEVLADTIDADLAAAEYNRKMVRQSTPPGILDLGEGIRPDQVDAFRAYWDAEIAGKSQVAVTGGGKNMKWTGMGASNADMQFMEWQIYLARKMCAAFSAQPQDIGLTFDVNRSQGETGQESTEDNGTAPLLDLVASYMSREVIRRLLPGYKFVFPDLGKARTAAADAHYTLALGGMSWVRPNDALSEQGSEGIGPVGDELWVKTLAGPIPMSIYLDKLLAPPAPVVVGPHSHADGPVPPGGTPPTVDPAAADPVPSGAPGAPDFAPVEGSSAKALIPFSDPRYGRLAAFYRPRG